MEKIVYNLSGSLFPIITDDLELTNFLFSFLQNSYNKIKENSNPRLSEKDILFLAGLDSLKVVFEIVKNQNLKKGLSEEKTDLTKTATCCCSEDLKKIEYYVKTIINSIDKELI